MHVWKLWLCDGGQMEKVRARDFPRCCEGKVFNLTSSRLDRFDRHTESRSLRRMNATGNASILLYRQNRSLLGEKLRYRYCY